MLATIPAVIESGNGGTAATAHVSVCKQRTGNSLTSDLQLGSSQEKKGSSQEKKNACINQHKNQGKGQPPLDLHNVPVEGAP